MNATANLSRAVLEDVFMRVDQHLRVILESIQSIVNFETPEKRKLYFPNTLGRSGDGKQNILWRWPY